MSPVNEVVFPDTNDSTDTTQKDDEDLPTNVYSSFTSSSTSVMGVLVEKGGDRYNDFLRRSEVEQNEGDKVF